MTSAGDGMQPSPLLGPTQLGKRCRSRWPITINKVTRFQQHRVDQFAAGCKASKKAGCVLGLPGLGVSPSSGMNPRDTGLIRSLCQPAQARFEEWLFPMHLRFLD